MKCPPERFGIVWSCAVTARTLAETSKRSVMDPEHRRQSQKYSGSFTVPESDVLSVVSRNSRPSPKCRNDSPQAGFVHLFSTATPNLKDIYR
jgi:hypothetical protein